MTNVLRQSFLVFVALSAVSAPLAAAGRHHAKTETLACRLGTEDRHARIAVVVTGGKMSEFAYYSKWKPRTCSVYVQRNHDAMSKWADNGNLTTVNLAEGKGDFLIEHKNGVYRLEFHGIDRERYCGMDGKINGYLIIKKGSSTCELDGIMEEGTPLGQANAQAQTDGEPATVSERDAVAGAGASTSTPNTRVAGPAGR